MTNYQMRTSVETKELFIRANGSCISHRTLIWVVLLSSKEQNRFESDFRWSQTVLHSPCETPTVRSGGIHARIFDSETRGYLRTKSTDSKVFVGILHIRIRTWHVEFWRKFWFWAFCIAQLLEILARVSFLVGMEKNSRPNRVVTFWDGPPLQYFDEMPSRNDIYRQEIAEIGQLALQSWRNTTTLAWC